MSILCLGLSNPRHNICKILGNGKMKPTLYKVPSSCSGLRSTCASGKAPATLTLTWLRSLSGLFTLLSRSVLLLLPSARRPSLELLLSPRSAKPSPPQFRLHQKSFTHVCLSTSHMYIQCFNVPIHCNTVSIRWDADIAHWASSSTQDSTCSVEPGNPEDVGIIVRSRLRCLVLL